MEAFMKKGQNWKEDVQFMFAKPGQLNPRAAEEEQDGMSPKQVIASIAGDRKKAIDFWRALGFRRIANSEWFATAFDALHVVHQLAAEDDFDPREGVQLDVDDDQKALGALPSIEETPVTPPTSLREINLTLKDLGDHEPLSALSDEESDDDGDDDDFDEDDPFPWDPNRVTSEAKAYFQSRGIFDH
ncbi:uncharacterized protein LY89DRAFT_258589 [Mollisia scopiformis]|uniref:Uncharacterized protein n=1 Tax=Mollisia scopiformis TaxID=149040 RepID=A0A132BD87_MOLSC|nr:uncharacterized protein LY89DRAFT_258589 [Mollisia scopiformis]KUJ10348.1 hypothetical protein LY89DRAFT_258589 [Mollisia scopiformis]